MIISKALLFTALCSVASTNSTEFARKDFFNRLFQDYEPNFQPSKNISEDIVIDIHFRPISINGLSEINQYLVTSGKLILRWKDQFLTWNQTQPGAPRHISIASDRLWMPPIVVFNTFDNGKKHLSKTTQVVVKSDGSVVWSTENIFKTACKIDISKFPFDQQVCSIILSPTHISFSPFVFRVDERNLSSIYQASNEWTLLKMERYKELSNESVPSGRGTFVVVLTMRRMYAFHVIKSVIPPVFLSLMNCFVFCLPAESGERLTMALSVLLSYTIYLSFINESLPENSDSICIFSIYLTAIFLLSIVIILVAIRSTSLHYGTQDAPRLMRWMVKNKIKTEQATKSEKEVTTKMFDRVAFLTSLCVNCLITFVCFAFLLS